MESKNENKQTKQNENRLTDTKTNGWLPDKKGLGEEGEIGIGD